jgi:hypothetical protein
MGLVLSDHEMSAFIQECDTNGDEVIDLMEMEKVVRRYRKAGKHFSEEFSSSHASFLGHGS